MKGLGSDHEKDLGRDTGVIDGAGVNAVARGSSG
jgi:hypothetical protein